MADNNGNGSTLKIAVGVGSTVAVVILTVALNVAASTYSALGEKLDGALDKINANTVAITEIRGVDDNLEWRMKNVEDHFCEVKKADGG